MGLKNKLAGAGIVVGIVAALGGAYSAWNWKHIIRDTYHVRISDADERDDRYLVFAYDIDDNEDVTFQNTDTHAFPFDWKTRSSDDQSRLERAANEQRELCLRTYGLRLGIFSWYPNIVDIAEVPENDSCDNVF